MDKKRKKLEYYINKATLNLITAGVNIVLGGIGAAFSLYYLLLFLPGIFFMGMAIYWASKKIKIEEEIDKAKEKERKETLDFIYNALEEEITKTLKGWNMFNE